MKRYAMPQQNGIKSLILKKNERPKGRFLIMMIDIDKSKLINFIQLKLEEKANAFHNLIEETRASNNDTKSSMGDKYETGREMLQQEINNLQKQLNEVNNQLQVLKKVPTLIKKNVSLGTIVTTEKAIFFIATSLGEITFDNQKIFIISEQSPLAKALWSKTSGDHFLINQSSQKILSVN